MAGLDSQQALFANEAFYLAFTSKDADAMDALWARDAPLVCVHPGWRLLSSRGDIMESWRNILGNPNQPGMDFHDARAHVHDHVALVTCYEELPGGLCIATNGFVEEAGQLRMVLHHAGVCGAASGD